jgi:hypothetical protein
MERLFRRPRRLLKERATGGKKRANRRGLNALTDAVNRPERYVMMAGIPQGSASSSFNVFVGNGLPQRSPVIRSRIGAEVLGERSSSISVLRATLSSAMPTA